MAAAGKADEDGGSDDEVEAEVDGCFLKAVAVKARSCALGAVEKSLAAWSSRLKMGRWEEDLASKVIKEEESEDCRTDKRQSTALRLRFVGTGKATVGTVVDGARCRGTTGLMMTSKNIDWRNRRSLRGRYGTSTVRSMAVARGAEQPRVVTARGVGAIAVGAER